MRRVDAVVDDKRETTLEECVLPRALRCSFELPLEHWGSSGPYNVSEVPLTVFISVFHLCNNEVVAAVLQNKVGVGPPCYVLDLSIRVDECIAISSAEVGEDVNITFHLEYRSIPEAHITAI